MMKKQVVSFILMIIFCLMILRPMDVHALTSLDPDGEASLTLHYQKDGIAFADLSVEIYRVAEAFTDGSFQLIEPFASYPINIHDITMQDQWKNVAQTLCSYIVADQVVPDREGNTDAKGQICFSELKTGLYFVPEVIAENNNGTYIFNQFLIYVPTPQPDGSYNYMVVAYPKCTNFVPKEQYTVTKLWQDGGNSNARPQEVTIDIYKDGVLQESQILHAENNWSYTWYVSSEDRGQWVVTERSVPENYKVTIQQNGSHFSVINSCQTTPEIPQTGDNTTLLPWILIMGFSGIMLMFLGFYSRRRG